MFAMEEIDISSVESSPRTDDSVVVYRYGGVIKQEDTPRQHETELLNEKSHRSNTTKEINDKGETSDEEVDITKSSDRVEIVYGINTTSVDKNSNIFVTKKFDRDDVPVTDKSFLNDTVLSKSIKNLNVIDEDSFGSIDTINDTDSCDKEVSSDEQIEISKPLLTTFDSRSCENGNEQILSVHSPVVYPVQFIPGNTFFRWNMEPISDISDVEYTGRYVPSLGYRPLKNVLDIAPNINSEKSIDSTRERGRIKRPWFYELTIEEEDGQMEEENGNDSEENNKERYIAQIDLAQQEPEIISFEKFNENLFSNTNQQHFKLDRNKIDSSVNLTSQSSLKFNNHVKVKANDLSETPSNNLPDDSKPLSENRGEAFKDKYCKTEKGLLNEPDIDKPNGNNVPNLEINIDPTNICVGNSGVLKCDVDNKTLSADSNNKFHSDKTHKCRIDRNKFVKELKDNLKYDLGERKITKLECDRFNEKQTLSVELNLNAGSSCSSYSDLTSITPDSLCQACRKKSSQGSSIRSQQWQKENPDAIRRQEENILRHLELIRLGRLLLENPSEFFRRKSGKRKNSMFNNRKNMSFSNDRLREIEWANKILLQKLVATSKRKQKS